MQYTYIKKRKSKPHTQCSTLLPTTATYSTAAFSSEFLAFFSRETPPTSKKLCCQPVTKQGRRRRKNWELLEATAEVEPLLNNHIISLAAAWSFEVYFLPGDSKGLLVPILKVNERNGRIISKIGKPHHIHGLLCGLQGFPFKKVFWDYLKKSYQQHWLLSKVVSNKLKWWWWCRWPIELSCWSWSTRTGLKTYEYLLSTLPYIPSFHWLCCEKQHYEVVWPTISCEYYYNDDFDSWQQGPLFIIIIIIVLLFVNEEEY